MNTEMYLPPEQTFWQGRADSPANTCFFQVIQLLNLRKFAPPITPAFVFIGFKCDTGIRRNLGRPGAKLGPDAIRSALARLPLPRQTIHCYDAGDIICIEDNLEAAQKALSEAVYLLLKHQLTPIVLGGGHELAFGHYQGIARYLQQEKLGIVNFDAHFDMRPLTDNLATSGTPFLQIAKDQQEQHRSFDYHCIGIQRAGNIEPLFTTAKQHQVHYLLAEELFLDKTDKITLFIEHLLQQNNFIYLSLCMDVFASAYAPGVSAPTPLGLTPWQIIPCLRQLAASGKIMSYDIAELSPPYDQDQRTAKLAANCIFEILDWHERKMA